MMGNRKTLLSILMTVIMASVAIAKNPLNYYSNKAEEAIGAGRFEDALDYARQEITDYADNPNGYYQAALSLFALYQPGQALSMVNKAIELSKKDKDLKVKNYRLKAEILTNNGDSIGALKTIEEGLKVNSKNIDLLITHATLLMGKDNIKASKDLELIKKIDPTNPMSYIYSAYIFALENKFKEALDEVTRGIQLDESLAYSYALRANFLKELGYTPDWIKDCIRSLELENELKDNSAFVLLYDNDDDNIRNFIVEEIEKARTKTNGLYPLEGILLYGWNKYSDASQIYQEIIDLGLDDALTYYLLADIKKKLNYPLDAYAIASNGLNKYPNDSSLKYIKVQIGIDAGKGTEVLPLINSLIAESPESSNLYYEKGRAYMSLGKYKDACEPLFTAVILQPTIQNKMMYADALRLCGDINKANSEYNEILQLSEDEIINQGFPPQYVYTFAYSGLGRKTDAIEALNKYSLEDPSAKVSYLPLVLARSGAKKDAIKAIEDYAKANTWNALFDLYTYDFHNLHTEQEFVDLLAEHGVKTRFNYDTNLLEYVPEEISLSSGGTSYEEVMKLLYSDPNEWVRQVNKMCPIDMGLSGQLVSVELDEPNLMVIYNYSIPPMLINIEELNNNEEYKKKKEEVIILTLLSSNPHLADLEINFKYNMRASDNSGKCSFVFSPIKIKELNRRFQSQDEIDKLLLDFWFEEEKIQMAKDPQQLQRVEYDGKSYNYIFPTNEVDGTFAKIELFQSDVKKNISSMFKDLTMQTRIPVYIRQNVPIKIIYLGEETGNTIEIEYTPEELKDYLN